MPRDPIKEEARWLLADIGQQIREIRQTRRQSQPKMASKAGIHRVTWHKIETGKVFPKLETVMKMLKAMNLNVRLMQHGDWKD